MDLYGPLRAVIWIPLVLVTSFTSCANSEEGKKQWAFHELLAQMSVKVSD